MLPTPCTSRFRLANHLSISKSAFRTLLPSWANGPAESIAFCSASTRWPKSGGIRTDSRRSVALAIADSVAFIASSIRAKQSTHRPRHRLKSSVASRWAFRSSAIMGVKSVTEALCTTTVAIGLADAVDPLKSAVPRTADLEDGRGERIRTSGPCLPKTVLYQAELLPDRNPRTGARGSQGAGFLAGG